jgi:hypothetical protein
MSTNPPAKKIAGAVVERVISSLARVAVNEHRRTTPAKKRTEQPRRCERLDMLGLWIKRLNELVHSLANDAVIQNLNILIILCTRQCFLNRTASGQIFPCSKTRAD